MAYDEGLRSITLIADSSVGVYTGPPGITGSASPNSGKQFCFVKVVAGVQLVGLAATAGGGADGILQNKPQHAGDAATVGIRGVSLCQAGATFTGGEDVTTTNAGLAKVANGTTDAVLGKALTAGASGELISVLLKV